MCLNKTTYFLIQHKRKLELKSTICNKIWKLEVEETHFEMERELKRIPFEHVTCVWCVIEKESEERCEFVWRGN